MHNFSASKAPKSLSIETNAALLLVYLHEVEELKKYDGVLTTDFENGEKVLHTVLDPLNFKAWTINVRR